MKVRDWTPHVQENTGVAFVGSVPSRDRSAWSEWREGPAGTAWIRVDEGTLETSDLTLGCSASEALRMVGDGPGGLVAWWCDPTIDFAVTTPPQIFGRDWPKDSTLRVDEIAFFTERGSWRAARTAGGVRWVLVQEVDSQAIGAESVEVFETPARLHGDTTRFSAKSAGRDRLIVREWRSGVTPVGFTVNRRHR